MNWDEMNALKKSELDPMAGMLYVRAFRYYMSFATGEVSLSLSRMAQELEYHPPLRSSRKVERPTVKRIRTLIAQLIHEGLIVQVKPGNAVTNQPAVYQCVLASTDRKRLEKARTGSVRPNPQGHELGTGQGHAEGHSSQHESKGLDAQQGHIDGHRYFSRQGHNSEISEIKDLSLTRERAKTDVDDTHSTIGSQLDWDTDFETTARLAGLNIELEFLLGIFESFRFHQKHRSTLRARNDWLAEWRVWCGREKGYGNHQTRTSGRAGGNQRPENPTARLLRESKETSDELERQGYYATSRGPDDDFES